MPAYYQATSQGYILRLMVAPGASRTAVVGLLGDRLKVRVAAAPEKGAANQELISFLARALNLPKSVIKLKSGSQSRQKVVELADPSPDLAERLRKLAPETP
jgi:uncharacterized protein